MDHAWELDGKPLTDSATLTDKRHNNEDETLSYITKNF
jgi:hypothetical protein